MGPAYLINLDGEERERTQQHGHLHGGGGLLTWKIRLLWLRPLHSLTLPLSSSAVRLIPNPSPSPPPPAWGNSSMGLLSSGVPVSSSAWQAALTSLERNCARGRIGGEESFV